MTDNRRIKSN